VKPTNGAFLDVARSLGAALCRDALWAGNRCNWLGDAMEFTGHAWSVVHRAMGPDLYAGTSGIALFLGRLYQVTREPFFRVTAEGAVQQARSRVEDLSPEGRAGFYSGATGIAYGLITVGELLGRQDLVDSGLEIMLRPRGAPLAPRALDIVTGSAGIIPVLLATHRRHRNDALLAEAVRHGNHLLSAARRSDAGWSWDTLGDAGERDLTGFSHGAAGISYALLELHHVTGEPRFLEGAEEGIRYEQQWFSEEHDNWPDFRKNERPTAAPVETPIYGLAWCHGAPGIGLSRLRAYSLLGRHHLRKQAEAALRTTSKMLEQAPPGVGAAYSNYSLCHGLAGNAELLLYADQVLGKRKQAALAHAVARRGAEQYDQAGLPWPCGVPGGGETPGLMLGLAGIGYFYLRLYDPHVIPPVLIILPDGGR
jgi:class II lanthipeptide synthase